MSLVNNYRINEGTLTIPEGFTDRSVNVFADHPAKPALAFNISRDKFAKDETLETYLERQLALLKKGLKQFTLLQQNELACTSGSMIEIVTTYKDRNNQIIYQDQAVLPIDPDGNLLIFTATGSKKMTETQHVQWRQLITSYQAD